MTRRGKSLLVDSLFRVTELRLTFRKGDGGGHWHSGGRRGARGMEGGNTSHFTFRARDGQCYDLITRPDSVDSIFQR